MEEFKRRVASLNKAQRQAVDTLEGPVMVVAGPGTGKTELLSVRAANILIQTDVLPENILCLTFTDNAANAMRDRLTSIIGKDAYKIAVHTFHSFGLDVVNRYRQYFYQGATPRPADEMSRYQIMREIFEELDFDNPLSSKLNDDFTHLEDSLKTISEFKKSGLVSDEILAILDANTATIEKAEQLLAPIFANRISKNTGLELAKHIKALRQTRTDLPVDTVLPLADVLTDSLETALDQALSLESTKPITAWKAKWFKKDEAGKYVLKSKDRQKKLRALCFVYEKYMSRMHELLLYDFDDMILRTVHAMEVFNDLRFNLQEQYQYIMVDEFQDTNLAQMRILHNLTNSQTPDFSPNILVVGDDDQAIYSFQGADISNIIDFQVHYPNTKLIALTDNYRSTKSILDGSRALITQGENRLENRIESLNKQLIVKSKSLQGEVGLYEAATIDDERLFVVQDIQKQLKSGKKLGDIAVLARRHKEILALLPYFAKHNIPVSYTRYDDVLKSAPVQLLEQLAHVLISINEGRHDELDSQLSELLSHEAWGINPVELWRLSLAAHKERKQWLEKMAEDKNFSGLQEWLIKTSSSINELPLEILLDVMLGTPNDNLKQTSRGFISPLYGYLFSKENLELEPDKYITHLEALRAIRARLIEYCPDQVPTLRSFVEFIELSRKLGNSIETMRRFAIKDAVNLMTAHTSKGLEFETVYVINVVDSVWGDGARSRSRLIDYPENLALKPAGETSDERLRLFYVAITRAKCNLKVSYSLSNDNGKITRSASMLAGLQDSGWHPKVLKSQEGLEQIKQAAELAWYQNIVSSAKTQTNALLPLLDNYRISITHLHNFLDVTRGGPAMFLMKNLLRFPQAKSPNAAYGTAVHEALYKAHAYLEAKGNKQAVEDVIGNFETSLRYQNMQTRDFEMYLKRGSEALRAFLANKYETFSVTQKAEFDFYYQQSSVSGADLTGKLDLVDIDKEEKSIVVADYKTGRPALSWKGKSEYEKIKLHKYRQQLLFYKLLIENSRDWGRFKVGQGIIQFIEPASSGDIISLETNFLDEDIVRFEKLIGVVWNKIMALDLPDASGYEQTLKGILAFEQDLIDGKV